MSTALLKWISLIGFTSTGKTSVGNELARISSRPFIDLDRVVEELFLAKNGKSLSCREIYAEKGASNFAAFELEALNHVISLKKAFVIATGGATPLNGQSAKLLKLNGHIVYLTATPETIFARMQNKGVPLYLRDDPTVGNLQKHLLIRDPVYRSISDITVNTENRDPLPIAVEVHKLLMINHGEKE